MRLLYITTWCPFPPDNGSKLRAAYLLRALAEEHAATLLTFSPEGASPQEIAALAPPLAGIHVIHEDAFRYTNLPTCVKYASPVPLAFWRHPAMLQKLREVVAAQDFDAVVAMSVPVAPYALEIKHSPRLLDVESSQTLQLEERHRAAHGYLARQRYRVAWRKSLAYEAKVIQKSQTCTLVSQKEADYYAPYVGDAATRLAVTPNGVDLQRLQPNSAPKVSDQLIFNGSLTYGANFDAMQYFLKEIYPRVRQQISNASLIITGSTQGVKLDQLQLDPSVHFSGYVADIRPLVAGASVCVAPLRLGGGTRLKILEAMALETPVVTTSKGCEGLDVVPGKHLLIGDDQEAFAEHVVRLLTDSTARREMAMRSRRLVEDQYDWRSIAGHFVGLVEQMVSEAQKVNPR